MTLTIMIAALCKQYSQPLSTHAHLIYNDRAECLNHWPPPAMLFIHHNYLCRNRNFLVLYRQLCVRQAVSIGRDIHLKMNEVRNDA